jgi:general secretion pathway protein A
MYAEYFGMREDPFRMTPDPGFLYAGPIFNAVLERLHAQLLDDRPILLLAGRPGTGKTTVLRKLETELAAAGRFVLFPYYCKLSLENFLGTCCELAKIPHDEETRLGSQEALRRSLVERAERGEKVVLFVDEAQVMADDVRDELNRLVAGEDDDRLSMQILFSGHDDLPDRLARSPVPAARQAASEVCTLQPLTAPEVGEYLAHRLRVAGCPTPELFEPEAVQRIAQLSSGIPRHINRLGGLSLEVAQLEARARISVDLVQDPAEIGADREGPGKRLDAAAALEPGAGDEAAAPRGVSPTRYAEARGATASTRSDEPSVRPPRDEVPSAQRSSRVDPAVAEVDSVRGVAAQAPAAAEPQRTFRKEALAAGTTAHRRGGSWLRYAGLAAGFVLGLVTGGLGMFTYLDGVDETGGTARNRQAPSRLAEGPSRLPQQSETSNGGPRAEPDDQSDGGRAPMARVTTATGRAPAETESAATPVPSGDRPVEPSDAPAAARDAPPGLTVLDARSKEDEAVPLRISVASPEGRRPDDLTIMVTGLPTGARLSAGVADGSGFWTLRTEDLAGLALVPPAGYSGRFELAVAAVARKADGSRAIASQVLAVEIAPLADAPTLTVADARGREDETIALAVDAALADPTGTVRRRCRSRSPAFPRARV